MNCLCDLKVYTVPNYVWPLNYNATFRPDLHEGMGLIVHGLKIECFSPTIEFNIQIHKIYYFYELNLSHVNLFGPSISPKSYLISFSLSSSFLSHYLCKSFNLCFLFCFHTFWHFFLLFIFFEYFYFNSHFLLSLLFNFYISFPFIHFFHIHFFQIFIFFF